MAFLLMSFTGCELPFGPEGGKEPSSHPSSLPSTSPSQATPTEISSIAAKKSKMNSEIFHEMFVVIFMREPKDRSEFGNWVDTLNQGASLEGIYNGLTRSEEYRALEQNAPKASEKAVKTFRAEVTVLEEALPVATQLGNFGLANIFTLKRVLGEEALKVISTQSKKGGLAAWYSKWAVHMTQRNVDFGLALRNKPDEAFHFQWASQVTEDQIIWETLNRLHRVLNEASQAVETSRP